MSNGLHLPEFYGFSVGERYLNELDCSVEGRGPSGRQGNRARTTTASTGGQEAYHIHVSLTTHRDCMHTIETKI